MSNAKAETPTATTIATLHVLQPKIRRAMRGLSAMPMTHPMCKAQCVCARTCACVRACVCVCVCL